MGRKTLARGRTHWLMLGPFLVVVALLALLTVVSVDVISAVRGYVAGESRWCKGQKDAVYHLERYITHRDPTDYQRFEEALAVPLADRVARQAMERQPPDLAEARRGLLEGGNHPGDVDGMVSLFLHLRRVSFMADAIAIWAEADTQIEVLAALGRDLQARVAGGDRDSAELRALAARLPPLNEQLTELEQRFSATLGEAARQARRLVLAITLVLALAMTLAAVTLTHAMLREQGRIAQDLRDSNERWALAADAAGLGLFDWDLRTRQANLDARGAALYGLPAEATRVQDAALTESRVHPDDAASFRAAMTQAIAGPSPVTARYRLRLDDNTVRHLEAVVRVRGGGGGAGAGAGVGLVGTLRDVTAEVQAALLQLEKDAVERASQAKSEFLSRVSHELRTPLNAVLGFTELMQSDPAEPLTPTQAQRVQHVLDAGRHLLALIDDILDLTDLDGGTAPSLQLQPVALADVVQVGLARVATLAQTHRVPVACEPLPVGLIALADRRRLEHVLVNLLSNAIQYNRPGGDVVVSGSGEGDAVCLRVRDTGPGLRADQLAALFQPFNRLGAEFTKVPGSGLGLVIAQQLLRRMGGAIEVSSTEGSGTCMTVRLRRAADQTAGT